MKLNLEEMREIARTLPIGYYLGRKVPVFVEDGNRAYCDVVKGDVHIGVGLLQIAADHIDAKDAAEWDRETLLRCLLYHEIGHLLLTPKWCKSFRVKNANGNSYREEKSNAILNIFEDERLECILSKYFMGVKFRKFVKLVCKGEGGGRKDDISKIYRAIRLRDAPKDVSDAVDAAIKNLAHIISVTNEWDFDPTGKYVYNAGLYIEWVNDLVAKILDFKEDSGGGGGQSQAQSQGQSQAQSQSQVQSEQEQSEQEQSEQDKPEQPAPKEQSEQEKPDGEQKDEQKDGKSDGESDDKSDADDKPDAEDDSEAEESSDSEESSGGDGEGDDGSDGESDKPDEDSDGDAEGDGDDEDADDAGGDDADGGVDGDAGEDESSDGDATGDEADASGTDDTEDAEDSDGKTSCAVSGVLTLPPEYLKEVADKVFATPTSDIENVLRRFAQRIAKQKGAQAAGRWSALTGRIDPRRDAQDKDRIFRRSSDVGDAINTAAHLTLWVDTSGSFSDSVPLLNQILAATYRAMKMSGGKLDVDVVKMNYDARVAGPNDWQIVAHGGNNINATYVDAWRKTRRKNKRNIDVVVFDGDACDYYGRHIPAIDRITRQIWDSPDCHLVVDTYNEPWTAALKRAHVTLLTGNYAESLRDEVVKLLDRIL